MKNSLLQSILTNLFYYGSTTTFPNSGTVQTLLKKNIIIIIIIINITHLRLYYICVVLWFKPELSRIIRSVLLLC